MLLLTCPWCGDRPEGEFTNLGEAMPPRVEDPSAVSDADWSASISQRRNIRGPHSERWWHARGCGTIFAVVRDTFTHEIQASVSGPQP
jgi:heterotetrameric sarcosine oxidase delta subunit